MLSKKIAFSCSVVALVSPSVRPGTDDLLRTMLQNCLALFHHTYPPFLQSNVDMNELVGCLGGRYQTDKKTGRLGCLISTVIISQLPYVNSG